MRRSLHPSFGQASGVRAALHPSGALTASGAPVWTLDPAISGEPWPGGTVDGTPGTPPSAATYEYEIGGVGTGDTSYLTFVPTAAQYSGSLTLVGDASGVPATSNALALEPVRGFTRAAVGDNYLRATTGVPAVPSAGTILAELILIANNGVSHAVALSWGRNASNPNRFGAQLAILLTTAQLRASFLYGPDAGYSVDGSVLPGGWGAPERVMIAARWNGSSVSVSLIVPGGSVTTTTGTIPASGSVAHATSIELSAFDRVITFSSAPLAATLEGAGYDVALSDTDLDNIAAAGSLVAWGAYTHGDMVWSMRPDPGDGIEGDLTVAGDVAGGGATWTIIAGTDDLVWGGLNEPV